MFLLVTMNAPVAEVAEISSATAAAMIADFMRIASSSGRPIRGRRDGDPSCRHLELCARRLRVVIGEKPQWRSALAPMNA
jgi:hypothetical protein